MDYMKMIGSFAGGGGDKSSIRTTNTEAQAMMNDLGAALDENDKARNNAYSNAFSNYMQAQNQQLAQREMAAGAAANAAANSAGPASPPPAMATGAAGAGQVAPQMGAQQALQAQMARAAMGQQQGIPIGAPGPSRELANAYIDPRTGMPVFGDDISQASRAPAGTMYPSVGAIHGGGAQLDDSALQAAYLRNRGI